MNAIRLMVKENQEVTKCFNLESKHLAEMEDFLADALDSRDWILTPEIREEVTRFESNFIIVGNPAGIHIRLTQTLQIFLKYLQRHYPPAIIRQMGASIFQCLNVFFTNLSSYPMGRERAQVAYRLLDKELEISADKKFTCQKGCSACCHLERDITSDEADLLAYLIKNGIEIDMQLLENQIAASGRKSKKRRISGSASRCVFLAKNNSCRIYDSRPSVCRKYTVSSNPAECGKKHGVVDQVPLIAEEVVVSAALSCHGNHYGPMSDMLGAALKTKEISKRRPKKVDVIRIRRDSTDQSAELQYHVRRTENRLLRRVE